MSYLPVETGGFSRKFSRLRAACTGIKTQANIKKKAEKIIHWPRRVNYLAAYSCYNGLRYQIHVNYLVYVTARRPV